ncbi:MAG: ABC transporter permease [Clostridia bacterium]|nr:ABC transporter permease [Clostridia bacterium]
MNKFLKFFKSLFCSVDNKEPKLLTAYKKESTKSILSSIICIATGVLIGFFIMLILEITSDDIPTGDAVNGFFILLGGPFASKSDVMFILGDMLFQTTPLLLTGLAVAVAFKTGLFNIGAPGQYLMGAMVAIIVALGIPVKSEVAGFFVWLLALICGMIAGALWGAIPGAFKALLGVNEVIVCIMTNWIAANVVSWVFSVNKQFVNGAQSKSGYTIPTIQNGVATPKLGLDQIFKGSYMDIGLFIAIAIAIVIYVILNKTTFGFELRACGHNKHAAKYAGMNEKRNIILSMAIAGALAGCGAALYFLNGKVELYWNTYQTLPADGFNGIPVALLASNNPIGVIFGSLFLRYIEKGGFNLAGYTMFNEYVSDLIIAIIIYFAGFSKLIKDILSGRKSNKKGSMLKKLSSLFKKKGKKQEQDDLNQQNNSQNQVGDREVVE